MSASSFKFEKSAPHGASDASYAAPATPQPVETVQPLNSEPIFTLPNYDPGPAFHSVPPVAHPPSSPAVGSFEHDVNHHYTLRWPSFSAMEAWMKQECRDNSIEFVKKNNLPRHPNITTWKETRIYVCARQGSGGKSKYCSKHDWQRKIASKRTGCPCRLTVKSYPGTSEVLGFYKSEHTHPIGDENVKFMRLDADTRKEIEDLLRLGVEPKKVLENITQKIYQESNLDQLRSNKARRRNAVTRADIRRIQKMIEEETIRLASQDGLSVIAWVETMRERGYFVSLKRSNEAAPPGSNLVDDSFVLIIQTKYQKECWEKYGTKFAGIDGTHNTTHYENMTLFTLLVRDKWGHGMPAAWMISSNGKEVTIDYFLAAILKQTPGISPNVFMSDFDWAQLNSIRRRCPSARLFLCWWHVLHAWQQHFVTQHYPVLWERLKRWLRMTDKHQFDSCWEEIQMLGPEVAPPSVIEYLTTYWMAEDVLPMWSAVWRSDRSIFETCDTNMLVEAWHHLLKGDFLEGKRNRRLDHLIHVLCDVAIPHFIARHYRQELGFEGPDLEMRHRITVTERAASIPAGDLQFDPENSKFIVRSQTDAEIFYEVDLDAYDCTCRSFPLIHFCKHICAVQNHFPEKKVNVPVSLLDAPTCEQDPSDSELDTELDPEINSEPGADIVDNSDTDAIAALTQRLQSVSLFLSVPRRTPLHLNETLRQSVHHATQALDLLSVDLAPAVSILPAKLDIAPNQNSWSETRAVMGVPVKSKKKRRHPDPYSGNEKSGKKAKPDARDVPPSNQDAENDSTQVLAATPQPPVAGSSYYRSRPNAIFPVATGSSLSPPVPLLAKNKPVSAPFDVDTFDIADVQALEGLNNRQLRELCGKYNVDTARANADMVSTLKRYHTASQRPQPQSVAFHTYPATQPTYSSYPFYFNYPV